MSEDRHVSLLNAIGAAIVIGLLAFSGGAVYGSRGDSPAGGTSSDMPANVDFSPVWKAWHTIDEKFVPAAVSSTTPIATTTAQAEQDRVWGMISGLAASLNDPYTYFLPPVENKQFGDDMSGQFEGVGMEIAVKSEVLTVVTPLKGTPAEKAGIKSGDHILKIDGVSTQGLEVDAAIKKIRGRKGTQVTLTMLRQGWAEAREIKVTRDIINVPTVTTTARKDGIFVIALYSFTANSPDLFRSALREFVQSGNTKLILDLRGNPGGYLDAAVDMASWFLPAGKVVVTEDYAGHESNIVHRSSGYDIFNENLKMVVLVNQGSASASEILADALRHYKVAKVVGTNTFGKGVVQELVSVTPETSLKITVARWLGPDGTQIPLTGLIPDVMATTSDEAIKADKDPQMDKALEILNAK
ncbi:MAG: S41 family peptidase [Patescibacteria group bacterium]